MQGFARPELNPWGSDFHQKRFKHEKTLGNKVLELHMPHSSRASAEQHHDCCHGLHGTSAREKPPSWGAGTCLAWDKQEKGVHHLTEQEQAAN